MSPAAIPPRGKRRRLGCLLAVLVLVAAGGVVYRVYLPEEFLAAEEAGRRFEETYPRRFGRAADVFYCETGVQEGPTLFLVHGAPGHWQAYSQYLFDPVLTNRFRIVAPDRPGYGGSVPAEAVPMAEQADRLAGLTEGRPRPWLWAGHSFGASVIARLAMDHPDKVDGLLLVAGAMSPDYERERWYHRLGDRDWIRRRLPPDLDVSNQEAIAFEQDFEDMLPRWSEIVAPTLIVHGDRDWMADFRHVAFATNRLTNAVCETVVIEGGGHLILWDEYEAVRDAMLRIAGMADE